MATIISVSGSSRTSYSGTAQHSSTATVGTTFDGNFASNVVCRYKFTTPETGATAIEFKTSDATATIRGSGDSSDDSIWRMRFALTTSDSSYINYKGNAGNAITNCRYGQYVQGSLNQKLSPNTTYYLWVFPASNFHGFTRFNLGGKCTVTLTGIYGTASVIAAANGTFGSSIPITLENSVNGVTNTLTVSCGGITKTLLNRSANMSASWTPSLNEYGPAIPNEKSAQATITCTTYYGDAVWGTATKTILVSFPSSVAPTISGVSITYDASGTGAASLTVFVQGYSKAKATISASAKYGATVSAYELTINGAQVSGASSVLTSSPVSTSGTVTAAIKVVDSRGFSASTTKTFYVEPYAAPRLANIDIHRSDAQGRATEDGTHLFAYAIGNISSVAGQNSMRMSVSFKTSTGSYGTETSMTSGVQTILPGLAADVTYVARITITDAVGSSATAVATVSSRKWAMKFNARGTAVGFGKAPEADKVLEIPADWRIMREQLFAVFYPVGAIYMSTSNVNPGTLFGGTWERITGRFLLGATDNGDDGGDSSSTIKPGGTGGKASLSYTPRGMVASHTLTVEEMPAHFHKMQYKANGGSYDGGYVWDTPGKLTSYTESGAGMASTGGGQGHAHNFLGTGTVMTNMPPYLAVYIWRRVS